MNGYGISLVDMIVSCITIIGAGAVYLYLWFDLRKMSKQLDDEIDKMKEDNED